MTRCFFIISQWFNVKGTEAANSRNSLNLNYEEAHKDLSMDVDTLSFVLNLIELRKVEFHNIKAKNQ